MKWISVEDRLPPKGKVLVWDGVEIYVSDIKTNLEEYREAKKSEWGKMFTDEVRTPTHWVPLPEPPEEKQDEVD